MTAPSQSLHALVVLAHFCERDGPSLLWATQLVRCPVESPVPAAEPQSFLLDVQHRSRIDSVVASLLLAEFEDPGIPIGNGNGSGNGTAGPNSSSASTASSSSSSSSTSINGEPSRTRRDVCCTFSSRSVNSFVLPIVKAVCLRSLSVEYVGPGREGPVFFSFDTDHVLLSAAQIQCARSASIDPADFDGDLSDDPSFAFLAPHLTRCHVLSYVFQLKDRQARGDARWHSVSIVLLESIAESDRSASRLLPTSRGGDGSVSVSGGSGIGGLGSGGNSIGNSIGNGNALINGTESANDSMLLKWARGRSGQTLFAVGSPSHVDLLFQIKSCGQMLESIAKDIKNRCLHVYELEGSSADPALSSLPSNDYLSSSTAGIRRLSGSGLLPRSSMGGVPGGRPVSPSGGPVGTSSPPTSRRKLRELSVLLRCPTLWGQLHKRNSILLYSLCERLVHSVESITFFPTILPPLIERPSGPVMTSKNRNRDNRNSRDYGSMTLERLPFYSLADFFSQLQAIMKDFVQQLKIDGSEDAIPFKWTDTANLKQNLIYHIISGGQVVVRSESEYARTYVLKLLSQILPSPCVSCMYSAKEYYPLSVCNFLGIEPFAIIPDSVNPTSYVCIDVKRHIPPGVLEGDDGSRGGGGNGGGSLRNSQSMSSIRRAPRVRSRDGSPWRMQAPVQMRRSSSTGNTSSGTVGSTMTTSSSSSSGYGSAYGSGFGSGSGSGSFSSQKSSTSSTGTYSQGVGHQNYGGAPSNSGHHSSQQQNRGRSVSPQSISSNESDDMGLSPPVSEWVFYISQGEGHDFVDSVMVTLLEIITTSDLGGSDDSNPDGSDGRSVDGCGSIRGPGGNPIFHRPPYHVRTPAFVDVPFPNSRSRFPFDLHSFDPLESAKLYMFHQQWITKAKLLSGCRDMTNQSDGKLTELMNSLNFSYGDVQILQYWIPHLQGFKEKITIH